MSKIFSFVVRKFKRAALVICLHFYPEMEGVNNAFFPKKKKKVEIIIRPKNAEPYMSVMGKFNAA